MREETHSEECCQCFCAMVGSIPHRLRVFHITVEDIGSKEVIRYNKIEWKVLVIFFGTRINSYAQRSIDMSYK